MVGARVYISKRVHIGYTHYHRTEYTVLTLFPILLVAPLEPIVRDFVPNVPNVADDLRWQTQVTT